MAFENEEDNKIMDATYDEFPNWNYDLGRQGLSIKEYWADFKPLASKMKMPVLFFTGNHDWMAARKLRRCKFPYMILFKSDVGHIPFMENKSDLEKAIDMFIKKYHF